MKRIALFVTFLTAVSSGACKRTAPSTEPASTPTARTDTGSAQPTPPPGVAPAAGSGAGSAAAAGDPWKQADTAKPKDPLPHPMFWAIEKDGKTSYALGTIHLGVDAEARLPQLVWDKLDAAKTFAMETDLADPSLMKLTQCDHCSLHKDLGEAYWKKLEDALTPPVARSVDGMKPMVAATVLSMKGLPQTPPMDGILLGRAQNQKKQIVYLELASKEAAVLEKWMNLKALRAMLDDAANLEGNTKEMLDAYVAGDEQQMVKSSEEERADALKHGYTPAEYDQQMTDLLYERNASWIPAIEKLHADGGGFIAVGAMHLVGKKSVLELLAAKGYKVTRLTP